MHTPTHIYLEIFLSLLLLFRNWTGKGDDARDKTNKRVGGFSTNFSIHSTIIDDHRHYWSEWLLYIHMSARLCTSSFCGVRMSVCIMWVLSSIHQADWLLSRLQLAFRRSHCTTLRSIPRPIQQTNKFPSHHEDSASPCIALDSLRFVSSQGAVAEV